MSENSTNLQKKHDEYLKGSIFFEIMMLGLTLLNIPLRIFGVTRFYCTYVFTDMIMDLHFSCDFLAAITAVVIPAAFALWAQKNNEVLYSAVLGAVTVFDLALVFIRENPLNYILSIFAHLWVIYTFIAITVLNYKLRRIS